MATAVAPSTTPLPTSPLYQVLVYPHHHNQSATPSDTLYSASPAGALLQLTKQHHYLQSINQLQLNASTDSTSLPPHTGPTAIGRPTFPLSLPSLPSDLDAPLVLQNTAVSLSQLTAEQKYPGKERDTPPAQWDEDRARVDEREGRDGPHMEWCKQLFLTHTAANVIRDQLKDASALGWTADDDAQYDSEAKARDTVMEALTAEQEDETAELDTLAFPRLAQYRTAHHHSSAHTADTRSCTGRSLEPTTDRRFTAHSRQADHTHTLLRARCSHRHSAAYTTSAVDGGCEWRGRECHSVLCCAQAEPIEY